MQNQWDDILVTTTYTWIDHIVFRVQTTGETLQIEVIIDGLTKAGTVAVVADTNYTLCYAINSDELNMFCPYAVGPSINHARFMARNVTVRIRKTTAAGAGKLQCLVKYWLINPP